MTHDSPNRSNSSGSTADVVDIAIVGAGMLGTPLALTLADAGWTVALIDQGALLALPVEPLDQRCTALAASTMDTLTSWGLWSAAVADASPIRKVHVSHKGYFGATRLQAQDLGVDVLGSVVDNRQLLHAWQPMLDASGVQVFRPARVEAVADSTDEVGMSCKTLTLNTVPVAEADAFSPREIRARLVVAADGVGSAVRRCVGIDTREVDYQQAAVLGAVALDRDHDQVAYERFTERGPLAILPRPGRTASFVWCINPDESAHWQRADAKELLAGLQREFGGRLGRFTAIGPWQVLSLTRKEATGQIAPRTVLLGNAARLLHPVAGQGYNLAMRDAKTLVELLNAQREAHVAGDPGAAALLDAFVAARTADQNRTVRLTDMLARTFRGRASVPSHLRALCLLGLDQVAPLRQRFARLSMGYHPDSLS